MESSTPTAEASAPRRERPPRMRPGQRRKGLILSIVEAMCTQAHASATGLGFGSPNAVTVGFALLLGARDPALGLLAALPVYANLAQFVGAAVAPRLAQRRPFVVAATLAARVPWFLVGLIPFVFGDHKDAGLALFLATWAVMNVLLNLSGNLWVSWIADLCPEQIRGRYFSNHALWATVVGIVAPFAVSASLDRWFGGVPVSQGGEAPLFDLHAIGFAVVFGIATLFGLGAGLFLRSQPEPERPLPENPPPIDADYFLEPIRNLRFRPFLVFVALFGIANGLGDPFWAPFQLEQLGLSYAYVGGLFVAVKGIVMAATLPFWGRIADRWGNVTAIGIALALLLLNPIYYLLAGTHSARFLMAADAATNGAAWAGINVAIFNLALALSPGNRRELYFACYVTVLGAAQATTSVLAGSYLGALPAQLHAFGLTLHPRQQVFALTGAFRFLALAFFLVRLGNVRALLDEALARLLPIGAPAPAAEEVPVLATVDVDDA